LEIPRISCIFEKSFLKCLVLITKEAISIHLLNETFTFPYMAESQQPT
jgi:hypothetical protein